jgi:hypothetical protein
MIYWATIMSLLLYLFAVWCSCWPNQAAAGSLADIEHVVLFMQENRAFNHVSHTFQIVFNQKLKFCSILGRWPESVDSKIRMFRSLMGGQSFTSMIYLSLKLISRNHHSLLEIKITASATPFIRKRQFW